MLLNTRNKAFTLVEMMLVLAIIVFMVGMALPFVLKDITKSNLQIAVKNLRNDLKHYQLLSKSKGKQVIFKYKPETSVYYFDDEEKKLPYELKFDISDNPKIIFYPNGRCEDNTIVIMQEERRGIVTVQGMTGRISVDFKKVEKDEQQICEEEPIESSVGQIAP
jgi:prepilin-type N-terminal cleavage/methylation domain-containing protein